VGSNPVTAMDVARVGDGGWINDEAINWLEQAANLAVDLLPKPRSSARLDAGGAHAACRAFVWSTYFLTKLTGYIQTEKVFVEKDAGYDQVRRWVNAALRGKLRGLSILDVDVFIFPINMHSHHW